MTTHDLAATGLTCPVPSVSRAHVLLGHGSGGKLAAELLRSHFLPHLKNPVLDQLGDAAVLLLAGAELAMSTDTFVVNPVEFPGGNIGGLAVHGTLNDLAMMGARPAVLSAGFVLEEGLELDLLDRVVQSMAEAANAAGVPLVTGDTKVVERGKVDRLFINTTGIGVLQEGFRPGPARAVVGDVVIASGPIGRHGMAIMAARESLGFEAELESDCATLWPLVERLRNVAGEDLHTLRDPTRGGVASALNEIAQASRVGFRLEETAVPVPSTVRSACDMLGLDPLYVANEGILLAILPESLAEPALTALRSHPLGRDACGIGHAITEHPGLVTMRTVLGGIRVVDLLPGDQLPRLC